MIVQKLLLFTAAFLLSVPSISCFTFPSKQRFVSSPLSSTDNHILATKSATTATKTTKSTTTALFSQPQKKELSVILDPHLTDERIKSLFAWISRAFAGDDAYNNLMLAMAAIFGMNLPLDSEPLLMVERANKLLPTDQEYAMGAPIPKFEREQASLGAMGAGQWTGQYKTRPHSLIDVTELTYDDWVKSLPRGCKRTLKKANAQNFTVTTKPIYGGKPAPHSSLSHFVCVVEHEVRLISSGIDGDVEGFFDGLSEAVGRYLGTTRMTGEIQEYRNEDGKIIAFAHEVRKGRTVRGQWFYCTNEGAKKYVWFHSVQELVKRAIDADGVDTVDLGPSGTDAFTDLKARYGFESVDDWPAVADYNGPFYYGGRDVDEEEDDDERDNLKRILKMLGR
jgi:hypothetical protein